MKSRPHFIAVLVALVLCVACLHTESHAQQDAKARFHDDALRIAFSQIGTMEKIDTATYRMTLPAYENSSAHPALVQVSATDKMFVDLSGSYGGKLFFDAPEATRLFQNRVLVDTVLTEGQSFTREYWIVYAGMGMWEGVINCSTHEAGRYYIVSLIQQMQAGKPGEDVDGTQLTAEALRGAVLHSLRDTTNVIVNKFSSILGSVQIQK